MTLRLAFALGLFQAEERLLEELRAEYDELNYILFFVRNPTSSTGKVVSAHKSSGPFLWSRY